jgi:hypothetical protein
MIFYAPTVEMVKPTFYIGPVLNLLSKKPL